jgi:Fe2+ transport system protein FeoA
MTRLSSFRPGNAGRVVEVQHSELCAKMTEMGLFRGKHVRVLFCAPFGGPMAIDVEGYVLSLRRDEADLVEVV